MWCSQTERVKGTVVGATAEILEFILKFLCVQEFYLRVCVCAPHVCLVLMDHLGLELQTAGYDPSGGCWELNSAPLEKQQVLFNPCTNSQSFLKLVLVQPGSFSANHSCPFQPTTVKDGFVFRPPYLLF